MFLLDTSIAIGLRDNHADTVERITALPSRPQLSVISVTELEGGVYALPEFAARRREGIDTLLAILPVIGYSLDMATAYGQIVRRNGFSRRKIIDRMIAATALVHDLTLITANGADFSEIESLKFDEWAL